MSTSTVTPEATNTLSISAINEVYRVYAKTDAEGKIITKENRVVTAGKDGKTWSDLDADTSYTNYYGDVTVREYKANSIEGCKVLVTDEEEFVNIFNSGLTAKSDRKLKAVLTELTDDGSNFTFEPPAVFDTLDLIQEATQRKNLTPVEKATRKIRDAVKAMFPSFTNEQLETQVRSMLSAMQDAGQVEAEGA